MKVQTLDDKQLQIMALKLISLVKDNFDPNILIGICNGGFYVSNLMIKALPAGTVHLPLTCRRPISSYKNVFLKKLFSFSPTVLNDWLRIREHQVLTRKLKLYGENHFSFITSEMVAIENSLVTKGNTCRVLIVDDAIDTGNTLLAVVKTVRKLLPDSAIMKTAVITLTAKKNLIQPDYYIYSDTLLRFPWSIDYKGHADTNSRS